MEQEMTVEQALKVLEMFLHKQCDLERTKFAYDTNTVWESVNMAYKSLKQEPFMNKPCVSAGVCEHDKMQVLDKIRAELNSLHNGCGLFNDGVDASLKVIDKYRNGEQK